MSTPGSGGGVGGGGASDVPGGDVAPSADNFNAGTFVTDMKDGTIRHESEGVAEPESMVRVRKLHDQIGGIVGTLNDKVAKVLRKQETEFLAAYRAHMYQVQKELQQLRAKANEAELALQKNEKIRALEDEREWYKKEALRLDKFASAMKKDLKYMKDKLESIEEDRNWLERQLKGAKKSNKLLRAELEMQMAAKPPSPTYGSRGPQMFEDVPAPRDPLPPPSRGSARSHSAGARKPSGGTPRARDSGPTAVAEAKYLSTIDRLETMLAQERRTVKALRAQNVAQTAGKAELETFFWQCINDVKKDVSRRRARAVGAAQKGRPGAEARGSSGVPAPAGTEHGRFDRSFAADRNEERARAPGLTDFTATDRKEVIRRLLSDDYVLEAVHRLIFGMNDGAPGARTDVDSPSMPASPGMSGMDPSMDVPGADTDFAPEGVPRPPSMGRFSPSRLGSSSASLLPPVSR